MQDKPTQLYRHQDAEGTLLYVGISLNTAMRLSQHMRHSGWRGKIVRIDIEHFENRALARDAELTAIRTEKPLWNTAGRFLTADERKSEKADGPRYPRETYLALASDIDSATERIEWHAKQRGARRVEAEDENEVYCFAFDAAEHEFETKPMLAIKLPNGFIGLEGGRTYPQELGIEGCTSMFYTAESVRRRLFQAIVLPPDVHALLKVALERYEHAALAIPHHPDPALILY